MYHTPISCMGRKWYFSSLKLVVLYRATTGLYNVNTSINAILIYRMDLKVKFLLWEAATIPFVVENRDSTASSAERSYNVGSIYRL
jgi:hypothetical protein